MNPFQDGYMSAPYAVPNTGEAALVGNGQAAMELMGTWAESVQKANSSSGSGIGSDLGWFPFPVVTGGKGAATGAVGGSNGFAIGSDAPPEAVDFLHFLASRGIASRIGKSGALPAALGITSLVEGRLIGQNAAAVDKADFIQPYLDQAGSDAFSVEIYAATAGLFDRTSNPERVCQAMTAASAIGR
jgi:raffinose/stachyose/melibiose transport system substrate-binding protein